MSDDNYGSDLHAWIEPEIEARVVALIFGEASPFEAEEIERLMDERPEIRAFMRRMESVHGLLGNSLTPDDDDQWELSPERKAEVLTAIGGGEQPEEEAPRQLDRERRERSIRRAGRRAIWSAAACFAITLFLAMLFSVSRLKEKTMASDEEAVRTGSRPVRGVGEKWGMNYDGAVPRADAPQEGSESLYFYETLAKRAPLPDQAAANRDPMVAGELVPTDKLARKPENEKREAESVKLGLATPDPTDSGRGGPLGGGGGGEIDLVDEQASIPEFGDVPSLGRAFKKKVAAPQPGEPVPLPDSAPEPAAQPEPTPAPVRSASNPSKPGDAGVVPQIPPGSGPGPRTSGQKGQGGAAGGSANGLTSRFAGQELPNDVQDNLRAPAQSEVEDVEEYQSSEEEAGASEERSELRLRSVRPAEGAKLQEDRRLARSLGEGDTNEARFENDFSRDGRALSESRSGKPQLWDEQGVQQAGQGLGLSKDGKRNLGLANEGDFEITGGRSVFPTTPATPFQRNENKDGDGVLDRPAGFGEDEELEESPDQSLSDMKKLASDGDGEGWFAIPAPKVAQPAADPARPASPSPVIDFRGQSKQGGFAGNVGTPKAESLLERAEVLGEGDPVDLFAEDSTRQLNEQLRSGRAPGNGRSDHGAEYSSKTAESKYGFDDDLVPGVRLKEKAMSINGLLGPTVESEPESAAEALEGGKNRLQQGLEEGLADDSWRDSTVLPGGEGGGGQRQGQGQGKEAPERFYTNSALNALQVPVPEGDLPPSSAEAEGLLEKRWELPLAAWRKIQAGDATSEGKFTARDLLGTEPAKAVAGSPANSLKSYGVDFPPGADVSYSTATGAFVVRNTPANLQLIDVLVAGSMRQVARERDAMKAFEKSAGDEPFSTFSLNVSDVSFKLAKAALERGEWPQAEQVRTEEFVNAFDYGDAAPNQEERVACKVEQAAHPFLQQRNLMRVSMRSAALGRAAGTPLRLTILLDNSGSMERTDRAAAVRNAFQLLAAQLNAHDQVTLISFARSSRLLADRVAGNKMAELVAQVDATPSEGGTNLEQALRVGLEKAREQLNERGQNRIILLTDGAANLGNAQPEDLAKLVESMRQQGIAFDACGVGADGFNDDILEALTRKGDGRYYFLDRPEDADAGFAKQIAGALRPAARNVKVQVNFNPERVGRYKLYGFEKHRLKKEDFRNDSVDAAELAAEEAGNAIYQIEVLPQGIGDVGTVSVRFQDTASGEMVERKWIIPYQPQAPRLEEASPSLRLASGAALLGEKLKGSMIGEVVEMSRLVKVINSLPADYPSDARVKALVQMTNKTRELAGN